ncbi:MAG: hypothetical protein EXX96DRAFT_556574 [Benjaminiella poitrasii]|nr:MAG: hypothetical protein EXX96DRAFT_556574 [Benjaminiella poitrasii]
MDWLHIDNWLLSIFKQTSLIPPFERSSKTFDLLTKLKKSNFDSIDLLDYILKNNINVELSDESIKNIEYLASIANSLGMGSLEMSNYITSISKLAMDNMELEDELDTLQDVQFKIDSLQYDATLELNRMTQLLDDLRKERELDDHDGSEKSTHSSIQNDLNTFSNLQKTYNDLGIEDQNLRLSDIHELETKRNAIVKDIKEKDEQLLSFRGLPLDMARASMKIRDTEKQLEMLEEERENLISDIAKSVH